MSFNAGDKVRLKGGKQVMIVEEDDPVFATQLGPKTIPCVWEPSLGVFKRDRFQVVTLEIAPSALISAGLGGAVRKSSV